MICVLIAPLAYCNLRTADNGLPVSEMEDDHEPDCNCHHSRAARRSENMNFIRAEQTDPRYSSVLNNPNPNLHVGKGST